MLRLFDNKNNINEEKEPLLNDYGSQAKTLLNYPISVASEINILSFLSFNDLYILSKINTCWKKEITTLLGEKYSYVRSSHILMFDAQKLAINLRKNLERTLNWVPTSEYFSLRRLYSSPVTYSASKMQLTNEDLVAWVNTFYIAQNDTRPIPDEWIAGDIFSRVLFFLSFISLTPLAIMHCLADELDDKLENINTLQQIYPRIDDYLLKNTIRVKRNQSCQPFFDAYNNTDSNIYGFERISNQVVRNTLDLNCRWSYWGIYFPSDIARSCEFNPHHHEGFGFVKFTPELHDLMQQCKVNSYKIQDTCGVIFYEYPAWTWRTPVGQCVNPPHSSARKIEIGLSVASFLLFVCALKKSGLFTSIKKRIANYNVARFFSENKNLIDETKNILKYQKEFEENENRAELKI